MARQSRTLPARRPRAAANGSLLIRSAESLGRMIGTLQRQLDGASHMLGNGRRTTTPAIAEDSRTTLEPNGDTGARTASGRAAKTVSRRKNSAATARPASGRATKRPSASAAKKTARGRSGTKRKSAK